MEKYGFYPYTPEYASIFKREEEKLRGHFDDGVRIEHVGSTAVPGLGGKRIVDICVGVPSKKDFKKHLSLLSTAGYDFRENGSTPRRLFFRRTTNESIVVHVHLVVFNSEVWFEFTRFRDYLKKNPEAVAKYIELKKLSCKAAKGDGGKYRVFKENFIKRIHKLALKDEKN
ncbi:MAG: GrpB family protein [Candidatus Micrarchaeota archaeon]